ncbi:hypothetical protein AOCH_001193 [Aspergillus ochraceoroseus]|uniref:DDHD domain-containing protein n=1 Tax=Aspergillus ochraceoroseus TaxID=138278 RepID=A0A0F8XI57_9EURO|nr:hypothetical protein AOCH_001193 [Aspergillus ochraceoroseus]
MPSLVPSASPAWIVKNCSISGPRHAHISVASTIRAIMAKESQKGTFLGAIPSWSTSKNTPIQPSAGHSPLDPLQRSQGEDHTVSHRQRLSLRYYPKDCPPLRVRWFYAVDSPKWKPSPPDQKKDDSKPPPSPKKFVPFTPKDSHSIEQAFQRISDIEIEREEAHYNRPVDTTRDVSVRVPVNEDYLFDVDIQRRDLSPAYWTGPVYEVRRGTWFVQDGSTFKPCEENLATQLEEGYLKVKPWRTEDAQDSLPQVLPTLRAREQESGCPANNTESTARVSSVSTNEARKYRLFGSYMSSIVTYQDASSALLANDDFMSTVYQKLGGVPGTRLVRGFSEMKKQNETQDIKSSDQKSAREPSPAAPRDLATGSPSKRPAELLRSSTPRKQPENDDVTEMDPEETLERRVSSLAGGKDTADIEEEARRQEEKEMEDSREADNEDREREVDHLVLVTHGIGQRLGLRLESVNFIHDVNVLRKTMKSVYRASPDLQALNSEFPDKHKNCRVQVLPVCWRHLLDFPYQRVGQNRKEHDLGDADTLEDDVYPNLSDITLESVPAVRNLISDLAVDVLLYQSKYCERISSIVKQECNRIAELYKKRNPKFHGSVSLCGHSLGSAILFDILCAERPEPMSHGYSGTNNATSDLSLAFECEELFCLGSPVALFQMLKGKTIAGRPALSRGSSKIFPKESDECADPPSSTSKRQPANLSAGLNLGDNRSLPKCRQLYNIFHPSDPVSYRMEPLISPAMSSLKPQPLPSVKRSIWTASGQSLSLISSRVGQSVGSLWTNFTSGVASSLLNRSLGLSSEDSVSHQNSSARPKSQQSPASASHSIHGDRSPTLIDPEIETLYEGFQKAKLGRRKEGADSEGDRDIEYQENERRLRKLKLEDEKLRLLNSNGRVDYSIQE